MCVTALSNLKHLGQKVKVFFVIDEDFFVRAKRQAAASKETAVCPQQKDLLIKVKQKF